MKSQVMKPNVIIGIGFAVLAVILAYLSYKGILKTTWLDKADKIASVVAMIIAIIAFINPFADNQSQSSQQVTVGNNNRDINIGQSQTGDVNIGDTSTSAKQRAEAGIVRVKSELLSNFSNLALLISTIQNRPPTPFWDIRRANETELAYQDRAANEFRDYQKEINDYIKNLKFSTTVYASFQREITYYVDLSERVNKAYEQQEEVRDSFARLESGLQHNLSLRLSDSERVARSLSLHKEKIANSKMVLAYAVAHFCLVADQSDMAILSDSLTTAGINVNLEPGNSGYKASMKLASEFAKQKANILQDRSSVQSNAANREINRRINDPYILMLREKTGLPTTLKPSEVLALQNKSLNSNERDPQKLFELAAFSYLESDGYAAKYYFQQAIDTRKLSRLQEKFARLSIHRITQPGKYGDSIGMMIIKLSPLSNFEKSGLATGDVIIGLDNQVVNEPLDVASSLAKADAGHVLLKIIRDGRNMIIKVRSKEPAGAVLTQLIVLNAIQL
jgi:hypothetical protein